MFRTYKNIMLLVIRLHPHPRCLPNKWDCASIDFPKCLVKDKMSLDNTAHLDLWDIIKMFPYPTQAR